MKNYFKLTEQDILEIKETNKWRCMRHNPFAYYINNSSSSIDSPIWYGSAVSDLVYWLENETGWGTKYDLDIVWYLVNASFYADKFDLEDTTELWLLEDLVEYISPYSHWKKYKERLISRYLNLNQEKWKD